MKKDIILAGVGGQGILTIAAIIDLAALEMGLNIKQAEVHGMSQRGGDVQSHLRISSDNIYSDLIPRNSADLILSVEPLESLRHIEYLSDTGFIVSSSTPYKNIPDYPEEQELINKINSFSKKILVNAEGIAREVGNIKTSNIVMLGAASAIIELPIRSLENSIEILFKSKGKQVIDLNISALHAGITRAQKSAL